MQINTGSVTATLDDGVLEIVARKAESAAEKLLVMRPNPCRSKPKWKKADLRLRKGPRETGTDGAAINS